MIADYICDWAKDVYRLDILRCLTSDDMDMRNVSPGRAPIVCEEHQSRFKRAQQCHQVDMVGGLRESLDESMRDEKESEENEELPKEEDDQSVEEERKPYHHITSCRNFKIRHLNILDEFGTIAGFYRDETKLKDGKRIPHTQTSSSIMLRFFLLNIPDELDEVMTMLQPLGTTGSMAQAAGQLLRIFEDEKVLIATMTDVYRCEQLWTGKLPKTSVPGQHRLRLRMFIHASFRPQDWQISRTMCCFTASEKALVLLSLVAGKGGYPLPLSSPPLATHSSDCLFEQVKNIKSTTGMDALHDAAAETLYQPKLRFGHFKWTSHWRYSEKGVMHQIYNRSMAIDLPIQDTLAWDTIPFGQKSSEHELFQSQDDRKAVLLRKPDSWPSDSPPVCLMFLEEGAADLSRDTCAPLVRNILEHGKYYQVGEHGLIRLNWGWSTGGGEPLIRYW